MKEQFREIEIQLIKCNENQPRKTFDAKAHTTLVESIKRDGLLQPITVRSLEDGKYEIIAGERRFRAIRELGWEKVLCFVKSEVSEEQSKDLGLMENEIRESLPPLDKAAAIKEYLERHENLSQGQMGDILGVTRTHVCKILSLNRICQEVRDKINCDPNRYPLRDLIKVAESKTETLQKIAFAKLQKRLNIEEEQEAFDGLDAAPASEPSEEEEGAKTILFGDSDIDDETMGGGGPSLDASENRRIGAALRTVASRIKTICGFTNEQLLGNIDGLRELWLAVAMLNERLADEQIVKVVNAVFEQEPQQEGADTEEGEKTTKDEVVVTVEPIQLRLPGIG